jgi:glycine cleavage system H lipoate-binding protein
MTALLVVATIVVLLTLDWLYARRTSDALQLHPERDQILVPSIPRALLSGGFELRENLQYHPAHTWAFKESAGLVRVGMDDFAARLMGTPTSIELPRRGQWLRQGQRLATLHRGGQAVEILSPMEGIVAEVNSALEQDPATVGADPYGAGWIVTVQAPDMATSFRNLLKGTAARRWMEEAADRLRSRLPALAGAVAQDGGLPVADMAAELDEETWRALVGEFLNN